LETLRGLPTSLVSLDCRANDNLTSLDDIPDSVEFIDATYCEYIETINKLPQNLKVFHFWYALRLKHIEYFPPKLDLVSIAETCLDKLPELPKSLKVLEMRFTKIKRISFLHEGIEELILPANNLHYLPPFPKSLLYLNISGNYKLKLPIALPPNIKYFYCVDDSLCIKEKHKMHTIKAF
jgi:Leucine-rich repeat (LRR) protein